VGGLHVSPGGSSGAGCLSDGAGDAGVGGVLTGERDRSCILKSPSASWSVGSSFAFELEAGERPICASPKTDSVLR
jgi:hypothetical protein